MNTFLPSARLGAAVLALAVWTAGCDATRVDQGAEQRLDTHIAALASADTPDKANRALRGVFNKVGIRTAWQGNVAIDAHPYGLYSVTDEEIDVLAERHAAFIAGQRSEAASYGATHAAVLDADARAFDIVRSLSTGLAPIPRAPITVGDADALAILRAQARTALASPETPESAIAILAAAASSDGVPSLSASTALSPAQEFLYSVWLHRNGPLMYGFSEAPARTAATARIVQDPNGPGDQTSCDPCCGGNGKFTDITFQYNGSVAADIEVILTQPRNQINGFIPFPSTTLQPGEIFSVSAAGRTNANNGFAGTLGNNVAIFVDGTEIDYAPFGDPDNPDDSSNGIHTSCSEDVFPGDIYGDFLVVAVATQNMGLCSSLSTCVGACQTEFQACDLNCHDQGGIGL